MGYTYVISELLYNPPYVGSIDAIFDDPSDIFSVRYVVADSVLLRRWFIDRGMYFFENEPEIIEDARLR